MSIAELLKQRHDLIEEWCDKVKQGLHGGIIYRGPITGLSYHSYNGWWDSSWLNVKQDLMVVPHPDNKYDSNAVGLNLPDHNNHVMIGWIPKGLNGPAAQALKNGWKLEARIIQHNRRRYELGEFSDVLFVEVTLKERVFQGADEKVALNQTFGKLGSNHTPDFKPLTPTDLAVGHIAANPNTSLKISEQGTYIMTIKKLAQQNVELAKTAAFLEAGRVANNQLSKVAGKKLPIMVRAYADTPLGRLIIANLANVAQQHFRPSDEKLALLAGAMVTASYQEVLNQFDIEGFIEDLLADKKIKSALSSMVEVEEEA